MRRMNGRKKWAESATSGRMTGGGGGLGEERDGCTSQIRGGEEARRFGCTRAASRLLARAGW